jgi:hypothetical protein
MGSAYVDHEHFHGKPFSNVIASSGLVALDFKIEVTARAHKRLLCCPCNTFSQEPFSATDRGYSRLGFLAISSDELVTNTPVANRISCE